MHNRFLRASTSQGRSENGFSLVSVVIAASLTSMFLLASAATIVPMYRSIGSSVSNVQMLSAAQSATDFTIALLNNDSTRDQFDSPGSYDSFKKVNLIYPLTASMFGLPDGATVEVWVRNVAPLYSPSGNSNGATRSIAFDPLLSPFNDASLPEELKANADAQKERWSYFQGPGKNGWRVIECRVKLGSSEKLLLTTLKPVFQASSPVVPGNTNLFSDTGTGKGLNSILIGSDSSTSAIKSSDSLTQIIQGTVVGGSTQLYNLGGDISSFGKIVLSPNSNVGGRVQVISDFSSTAGSTKGAIALDSSSKVNQYLEVAGTKTGFNYEPGSSEVDGNVVNAGPVSGEFQSVGQDVNSVLNATPPSFQSVAPAPSAPNDANYLTADSATVSSGSGTLSQGSAVSSNDYVMSSLTVKPGATLNPDSTSSGNPTRIFLEGSNSNQAVLEVQGNINSGGDPSMVQIYYNGSGTLSIVGTGTQTISATIYAPNANLRLNHSSGELNFTGGITARNIAGSYDDSGNPITGIGKTNLILDYSARSAKNGPSSALQSLSFNMESVTEPKIWKVVNVFEPKNPKEARFNVGPY